MNRVEVEINIEIEIVYLCFVFHTDDSVSGETENGFHEFLLAGHSFFDFEAGHTVCLQ